MKVYVLQSVEYDEEETQYWGYIYPNDDSFRVFSSFYNAFEYVVNKKCPDWDIDPKYLYAVTDPNDPTIKYLKERENERTTYGPIVWAVIIEREMED